uniref:F5/8 type C domain-containing protein n=1 Tax=Branchiostoma floridae TaxID=7739 RepID=C3YS51_BRAFL|eukprot:XP_002600944.1 hypothetical protein BRAFLDRAFT_79134 [Branchiostoma floridae]
MKRTSMRGRPLPALPMTNMKGRPLPALPDSKVLPPSHQDLDTECTTLYNGTEEQSPDTFGSHDDPTNENQRTEEEDINDPRQASQQSGQSTVDLEDTDRTDRTSACLLDNPMYAAGAIQQDDGEPIENTTQSGHDGQPTAEDTDKMGRNGARLMDSPMYVAGVLPQDDGDNNDAANSCVFPGNFNVTSHRFCVMLFVIIAIGIGAGAGLVIFLTTVQETHPPTLSSSLERSGTSSRPVSPFPAIPTGSTLENKSGNPPTMMIVTEDPTNATAFLSRKTADGMTLPANVLTHSVERTGFDQLQTTTKQQPLTTLEGKGNLAINKTATQSSDYVHWGEALCAGKAVDGSRATDIKPGKACAHTKYEYQPWWKVDLSRTYIIKKISILNRGDCCGERLKNFTVRVGLNEDFALNDQCGEMYTDTPEDGQTIVVYCSPPISGRYVSVQLMEREDALSLCEVEVYAETGWLIRDSSWVVGSTGTPWVNDGVTYDAAKVLDGDILTLWNPTGINNNRWYIAFDLTVPQTLTRIAVNNFGDTDHDIAAFTLQNSQVGSPYNWEDVVTVTTVQGGLGTYKLQEFGGFRGTARYWRFLITRTHLGWHPWLRELNFHGI